MTVGSGGHVLLDDLLDRVDIGICVVDRKQDIVYWNHFMQINSGRPPGEVQGKNIFACFPELGAWLQRKFDSVFLLGHPLFSSWEQRPYVFRFPSRRAVVGGLDHMAQNCTFMPIRDQEQNVAAVCLIIHDATDTCVYQKKLKTALAQINDMAIRDEVTQVFNRRHIEQLMRVEFSRSKRYRSPFSLLLADLDYFKKVNDVYGHLAGDAVLRAIALRIGGAIRNTDAVGRYGGEELLVLFPAVGSEGARVGAERLRRAVEEQPVEFEGQLIQVTVSIGVDTVGEQHKRPEDLLEAADKALYVSKRSGRNRVTLAVDNQAALSA